MKIMLIGFFLLLTGCFTSDNEICRGSITFYKEIDFNLVLEEKEESGRDVTLKGYDPNTKKPTSHHEISAFFYDNYHLFKKGDTVLKEKEKPYILIKKKDKCLILSLDCGKSSTYINTVFYEKK